MEEDPAEEASEEVEEGAGSRWLELPTAGLPLMALLQPGHEQRDYGTSTPRKPATTRMKRSGSSTGAKWPLFSKTANRESLMPA